MVDASEEFVEPSDGVVASILGACLSSRCEHYLLKRGIGLPILSITALLIACGSCIAFIFYSTFSGGCLALFHMIFCWLSWRMAQLNQSPPFWNVLGSTFDRLGEALLFSGIIFSHFLVGRLELVTGILSLVGSLTISYTAVRSGREFRRFIWTRFSAYGATRDVRVSILAVTGMLGIVSWGVTCLAVLTFAVLIARFKVLFSFSSLNKS